jgi:hypothetical protein
MAEDLAEERIDKEVDARAVQGIVDGAGWREQVRRVGVGQEARHNAGFDDDLAIVREGGDQAALEIQLALLF